MQPRKELTTALFISALILSTSASGLSFSVASNVGGFNKDIQAGTDEQVVDFAVVTADSLSDVISGSGDIKMSFSKSSDIGSAVVGFDIKNSESYSYGYSISDYSTSVSDTLEVNNADMIAAYAKAWTTGGDRALVSTMVSDEDREASLNGYTSAARVESYASDHSSGGKAWAWQEFKGASGDNIKIHERAANSAGATAGSSIAVNEGSIDRYSGTAQADQYMTDEYNGRMASTSHAIYYGVLSASRIEADEWAINTDVGSASTSTKVNDGSMDMYNGGASAGARDWITEGSEEQYVGAERYGSGLSGDAIRLDGQTINNAGYLVSTSTIVNEGSMGWYSGSSGSGNAERDTPVLYKMKQASAWANYNDLAGRKIQINELAANIAGDVADSRVVVNDGFIDSYTGSSMAGLYQNDWVNEQSASAGHSGSGLSGDKVQIEGQAFNSAVGNARTRAIVHEGYLDMYSDDVQSGRYQSASDQWEGIHAVQNLRLTFGTKLDLTAKAINAKGIKEYKHTMIKNPVNIGYENSANVNLGVPSACQSQY